MEVQTRAKLRAGSPNSLGRTMALVAIGVFLLFFAASIAISHAPQPEYQGETERILIAAFGAFSIGFAWKRTAFALLCWSGPSRVKAFLTIVWFGFAIGLFFGLEAVAHAAIGGAKSLTTGPLSVGMIFGSVYRQMTWEVLHRRKREPEDESRARA